MTKNEIRELQGLLLTEAENNFPFKNFLRSEIDKYFITENEMIVFNLDRSEVPKLMVAYLFYEDICERVSPPHTQDRTHELLMKAQKIVPAAHWYDHEKSFDKDYDDAQWYVWVATTFGRVSLRQAYAFYAKMTASQQHLSQYPDEN